LVTFRSVLSGVPVEKNNRLERHPFSYNRLRAFSLRGFPGFFQLYQPENRSGAL